MKITKENIYLIYIFLGLLYFICKVIFYICGFVYFRGVILGLIATILTVFVGILSSIEYRKGEYKKGKKFIAHYLPVLTPLIIISFTPIIMARNLGSEMFQIEKIIVLIIFECLAVAQVILAIFAFKKLKLK